MSSFRQRKAKGEKNSAGTTGRATQLIDSETKKRDGVATFTPSSRSIFFSLFIIRAFNALTTRTFFQADEFFQCLEPAHKLAFGYGYITWEWTEKLRSAIHPLLYSIAYKLASLADPNDKFDLVIILPKLLGAAIAAIGELYTYKFICSYYANERRYLQIAKIGLMVSVVNPFNWYIITRSFSNNLEMVLTTIALSYWPWNNRTKEEPAYIRSVLVSSFFGIVSCIVRPTNAILWLCLGAHLIHSLSPNYTKISKLIAYLLAELATILLLNSGVDYLYYGELTFPVYNFIEFNVIKSLSIFYGVAPWHFYIFQAIPLMSLTLLPFLLHYLVVLGGYKNILGITSIVVVGGFSFIKHKEFRFIYPLQPLFTLFIAKSVDEFSTGKSRLAPAIKRNLIIVIVAVNALIAFFFTRVQERGVIDVIQYLKQEQVSFGFLTPCHSTPWQSYLHNKAFDEEQQTLGWALTCEPPLHLTSTGYDLQTEIRNYRDESDNFFDDPKKFIESNFPNLKIDADIKQTNKKYAWPSRLIVFQPAESLIQEVLGEKYVECKRFFNSYFHWDDRRNGDVIVFCAQHAT